MLFWVPATLKRSNSHWEGAVTQCYLVYKMSEMYQIHDSWVTMLVCYYFVSVVAAIGCCCKLVVITNPAVVLSQNTGLFVYSKLSTVQHVLSAEKVQNVKVVPCLRSFMHILGPSSWWISVMMQSSQWTLHFVLLSSWLTSTFSTFMLVIPRWLFPAL